MRLHHHHHHHHHHTSSVCLSVWVSSPPSPRTPGDYRGPSCRLPCETIALLTTTVTAITTTTLLYRLIPRSAWSAGTKMGFLPFYF
ncbi:hypothetical protein E2C01_009972 [Portunus trituberculatus]|uniref:Uncharacterized protein n=1 Tax=Portunus trituberculatus TaxID=210409 RepID=A0A5B7D774_PORTR|nr:hypothetical protein [Portunus trituberculatus]